MEKIKLGNKFLLLLLFIFGIFTTNPIAVRSETFSSERDVNSSLYTSQQQIEVTGTVTDAETGDPLPGVNIVVEGTTTGTSTDMDGEYSIEVPSDATLVFSFVGYQEQTVDVNGREEISVTMEQAVTELEEVVAVGYGQQSRVTTTGAISGIDSEELGAISTPSMGEALAGKAPGLAMVQTQGEPGASDPDMYLRGIATFNDVNPLIIIDGVPNTKRAFMQLNPKTIANISVLKDASATAVYGVRGANGVIIVDTKRGQAGKANIEASFSTGLQTPTNILDFANSYEWGTFYNQARANDNAPEDEQRVPQEHLEHFRKGDKPLIFPSTDWTDLIEGTAQQTRANLNISGGSEDVQHFSSISYFRQNGLIEPVIPEQESYDYERFNLKSNVDISITPTTQLDFTTGARIGTRTQPRSMWRQDQSLIWDGVYTSPPMWGTGMHEGKYVAPSKGLYQQYIEGGRSNPVFHLVSGEHQIYEENRLHVHGNFEQQFKALSPALEGLKFRAKMGYRAGFNKTTVKEGPNPPKYFALHNGDAENPNPALDSTATVLKKSGSRRVETWNERYGANRYLYMEAGLDYNRSFGDHNLTGLMLYNQNKNYYPSGAYSNIPSANVGLVGRVTYNYSRRYMLEVNVGYNGSENFAPERRYGWFPSLSGSWVVSEENFMQGLTFLDQLKLRASYGKVGSDQAGGGDSRFSYVGSQFQRGLPWWHGYYFGNQIRSHWPGVQETEIGNPNITWETSWKQNYGVDIALFDERLTLNVDYFYEHRDDILMYRNSAPDWIAMELPAVNIGEVENEGFEVQLGWNGQVGDLQYNISGNVARAQNTILFMDEIPPVEDYQSRTGHPMNVSVGYVALGFYTEDEIEQLEQQRAEDVAPEQRSIPDPREDVKAGDMKYKDLNGDGIIDNVDTKVIGEPSQPEVYGGINGSLSYKGFDLSFGFQGAAEVSRNIGGNFRSFSSGHALFKPIYENSWSPENSEDALWPRPSFDNQPYNSRFSTYWNRDASFLRLKRAEMGYTFSGDGTSAFPMKQLRVYIRGNNLYTFKKEGMKWFDPEQDASYNISYPLVKLFMIGVQANF